MDALDQVQADPILLKMNGLLQIFQALVEGLAMGAQLGAEIVQMLKDRNAEGKDHDNVR